MNDDEYFDNLLKLGVFEVVGLDENGERLLVMNPERAKEYAPDLYWSQVNEIDEAILKCIDLGLLEIDVDPDTMEVVYRVVDDNSL